jgi:hypothetical protein
MLQAPVISYWISVHNTAGKTTDSDHYSIGVKPSYSAKGKIEVDIRPTRIAGTMDGPAAYFTNNSTGPVYGSIDLLIDGKIVYTSPSQVFGTGQTQVNLEWKSPSVTKVTQYPVQVRAEFYDKSFETVSSTIVLFPGTLTLPLSSLNNIETISLNNHTIAQAAVVYSSFYNDGTKEYQVTAPDGTCVIGAADNCLVTNSTLGLPGNFKTGIIGDQVFRIRYVGMDEGMERFSITSVDPITGSWHVAIVNSKQGLAYQAEAVSDVFVKIKYRDIDTSIITLTSKG